MKVLAIIPARYASTRFPAKPLAMLGGKPIVQRVYEAVAKAVERVVVATDDKRIYDAVVAFGGEVKRPPYYGVKAAWGEQINGIEPLAKGLEVKYTGSQGKHIPLRYLHLHRAFCE